jgi:hypothetical protein
MRSYLKKDQIYNCTVVSTERRKSLLFREELGVGSWELGVGRMGNAYPPEIFLPEGKNAIATDSAALDWLLVAELPIGFWRFVTVSGGSGMVGSG